MLRAISTIALFCLLWVAVAREATASASAGVVVIFVEEGAAALGRRLRQEIESLGLGAVSKATEVEPSGSPEIELKERGAVAVLRVSTSHGGAVEIWLADKTDGSLVVRKLVAARAADPSSAELLATQTIEVLRANLMVLPKPPAAQTRTSSAKANEHPSERVHGTSEPPPRTQDIAVSVGPALVGTAGFTPGAHVLLGVTYVSPYRLGVSGSALLPVIVPAHLSDQAGSVDLDASIYRVSAIFDTGALTAAFSVRFSAGLALARLHLTGTANAPDLSAEVDRVAWSPSAGAALTYRLSEDVRFIGEASAFVGFPRTIVRLAGREVTAWGRPAIAGSVGIQISLPVFAAKGAAAAMAPSSVSR